MPAARKQQGKKRKARTDARRRGDPRHADFRIEDSPFYHLARVNGRYRLDMERILKTIGMDIPRWRTLMIARELDPSSISEIAEHAVMRLSTVTRVVQGLEKRGLVRLARGASDARRTDVYLTAAGRRAVTRVREVAGSIYAGAFTDFSAAEVETLLALLQRVYRNLDRHNDSAAGKRR
jgi:MarR family transcriptional regulator, organic hydroperoxide resistance regulator